MVRMLLFFFILDIPKKLALRTLEFSSVKTEDGRVQVGNSVTDPGLWDSYSVVINDTVLEVSSWFCYLFSAL